MTPENDKLHFKLDLGETSAADFIGEMTWCAALMYAALKELVFDDDEDEQKAKRTRDNLLACVDQRCPQIRDQLVPQLWEKAHGKT